MLSSLNSGIKAKLSRMVTTISNTISNKSQWCFCLVESEVLYWQFMSFATELCSALSFNREVHGKLQVSYFQRAGGGGRTRWKVLFQGLWRGHYYLRNNCMDEFRYCFSMLLVETAALNEIIDTNHHLHSHGSCLWITICLHSEYNTMSDLIAVTTIYCKRTWSCLPTSASNL